MSELPLKRRAPVCMKQKTQPKDHISTLLSQRFSPTSSSGARQKRVPTWLVMSPSRHSRAIPKSMSLTQQFQGVTSSGQVPATLAPSIILPGLRSRCSTPHECRYSSPWTIQRKVYFIEYLRLLLTTCQRLRLSHSIAKAAGSSQGNTYRTRGMWRSERKDNTQCSRTKLMGSPILPDDLKRLTATSYLVELLRALQTSPQVPSAMRQSRVQRSISLRGCIVVQSKKRFEIVLSFISLKSHLYEISDE